MSGHWTSERDGLFYEGTENEDIIEIVGVWGDGKLRTCWSDEVSGPRDGHWTPKEFARWFTWPGRADGLSSPEGWVDPADADALLAAVAALGVRSDTEGAADA